MYACICVQARRCLPPPPHKRVCMHTRTHAHAHIQTRTYNAHNDTCTQTHAHKNARPFARMCLCRPMEHLLPNLWAPPKLLPWAAAEVQHRSSRRCAGKPAGRTWRRRVSSCGGCCFRRSATAKSPRYAPARVCALACMRLVAHLPGCSWVCMCVRSHVRACVCVCKQRL